MGIENLKKIALLIVNIVEQSEKSFKDGVQASDLPNFLPQAFEIIRDIPSFKQLPAEIRDLSAEEITELRKAIRSEFQSGDAIIDALIDAVFGWVISSWELYQAIKDMRLNNDL